MEKRHFQEVVVRMKLFLSFYLCRYQNQNFSFVLQMCCSCSTCVSLVLLAQHLRHTCITRVSLVSLVSHSCCTRVTSVTLVLHLCHTHVARVWHLCCKLDQIIVLRLVKMLFIVNFYCLCEYVACVFLYKNEAVNS